METRQLKIKGKYQNKILILGTMYDNDHHGKGSCLSGWVQCDKQSGQDSLEGWTYWKNSVTT